MLLVAGGVPARLRACCCWRQLRRGCNHALPSFGRPAGSVHGRASRRVCGSAAAAPHASAAGQQLLAPSVEALECLASIFGSHIRAGDCYCLYGSVGAGKSTFSRAFIRSAVADELLAVPSPTFLLQNTYDEHDGPPIHHFDFYRLQSDRDFGRLNLDASFSGAVCLVEWAERLQAVGRLPDEHLAVHIEVVLKGNGGTAGEAASRSDITPVASQLDPAGHHADGDEAGDFTDVRPRMITLVPHGGYWALKVQRVIDYIAVNCGTLDGLVVRPAI